MSTTACELWRLSRRGQSQGWRGEVGRDGTKSRVGVGDRGWKMSTALLEKSCYNQNRVREGTTIQGADETAVWAGRWPGHAEVCVVCLGYIQTSVLSAAAMCVHILRPRLSSGTQKDDSAFWTLANNSVCGNKHMNEWGLFITKIYLNSHKLLCNATWMIRKNMSSLTRQQTTLRAYHHW